MGPLSEANFRLQVLDKAGLSPNKLADLLRKSIATLEECAATAMSPLAPTMPDWHARLGAIRQMIALTGAQPGKAASQSSEGGQVAVTINMPDWASNALPKPVVIEATQPRETSG